jgi:predicted nucleic acid-binding protein
VTPGQEPIVIDANILFSALLNADNGFSHFIFTSQRDLVICETTLAELFRHKEKLIGLSRLDASRVVRAYLLLLQRIELYKEKRIQRECWTQARELCTGIDPDDEPQVALTLALDGVLWTGDKALKTGLMAKGFDRFFTL